jgi:hypothetical protein
MIKIKVTTKFDITATGVTGHFKLSGVPFTDRAGYKITDSNSWNQSRNRQRNWETLTQLIGLRTQIMDITQPTVGKNLWSFEFTTETEIFNDGNDPVGVLKADSDSVPMLRELDNDPDIDSVLIIDGPRQNIWFTSEAINNILEN